MIQALLKPTELLDKTIAFGFFNMVHKANKPTWNNAMCNNFTALTHASLTVLGAGSYLLSKFYGDPTLSDTLYYSVQSISTGYFIYDMLYIAKNGKRSFLNAVYLYHHLATLYIIHKNPEVYRAGDILFWGELSNIPMYFVYYYMKNKLHSEKHNNMNLALWKKIQAYMYGIIRWPILSYLTYTTLKKVEDPRPIYVVLPVYFMGIFWTINLFKKL